MVLDMKEVVLGIIMVLSTFHWAIGQNGSYSIQEPDGYCYNVYSYQGHEYPICYRNTWMEKTQFHFNNINRRFIILHSEKYSPENYNQRILLYDTKINQIREIDSCTKNSSDGFLIYMGTEGDTLYVSDWNDKAINAINLLSPDTHISMTIAKADILKKIASIPYLETWCLPIEVDKVAYTDRNGEGIFILCHQETMSISGGPAEVIAWVDSDHLLYSKIIVEGYGDFYYDLWEYSVREAKSKAISKHLYNVFDYHNGILLYEKTTNMLCLAEVKDGELSDLVKYDLSDYFIRIYSAYLLNPHELIIGGDRLGFDTFYYKFTINND